MLNPYIAEMLNKLENLIKDGVLTHATHVDCDTFICFTEKNAHGVAYHQFAFEQMPKEFQIIFKGYEKGTIIGPFKIIAIFHVWPEELSATVPPTPKRYAA